MTQFATPILPKIPTLDELDKPSRVRHFDQITKATRAATPAEAIEKREQPRLSVSELNSLDFDAIRERFHKQRYDTRGPVTKFLDILDLPRNTIASIVFPSIERRKRMAGEIGTGGRGIVRGSDILEELGVDNRIIRGAVGFGLDVATDPLTYLGPAGWGFQGVSAGGKVARATKAGKAALSEGMEAVKAGRTAADPALARALKAKRLSPEAIAERVAAGEKLEDLHGEAGRFIYGGKQRTKDRLASILGADRVQPGGWLSEGLYDVGTQATDPAAQEVLEASKDFMARYGRQNQPGIRIGKRVRGDRKGTFGVEIGRPGVVGEIDAGSQIAHIPFTDWAISVPGMTKAAQLAKAQGIAAGALRVERDGVTPVDPASRALQSIVGDMEKTEAERRDLMAGFRDIDKADAAGVYDPEMIVGMRTSLGESIDANAARHQELAALAQTTFDEAKSGASRASTPADILYQGKLATAAENQYLKFVAEQREAGLEGESIRRLRDELLLEQRKFKAPPSAPPVKLYHGTTADLSSADELRPSTAPQFGKAIYFATDPSVSSDFASGGGKTLEAYLQPSANVFDSQTGIPTGAESTVAWQNHVLKQAERGVDADLDSEWSENGKLVGEILQELGYDAAITKADYGLEYAVFNRSAITSTPPSHVDPTVAYRDNLDAASQRLLDMTDDEVERIANQSGIIAQKVDAQQRLADAMKAPLLSVMDESDSAMRDLAAVAVGLSPDEVPMHAMGTLGTAFAGALGRAPDLQFAVARSMAGKAEGLRQALGLRGGTIGDLERTLGRLKKGTPQQAARLGEEFLQRRNALAVKHGITDTAELGRLMSAMAFASDSALVGARNDDAVQAVLDAAHSGLFKKPGLYDELKALTDEMRGLVDELGTADVGAGMVGNKIDQYGMGNVLSREARAALRSQERNVRLLRQGKKGATPLEEPFSKARSTLEHTWTDAEGNVKSFSEYEKYVLQFDDPDEITALGPAFKAEQDRIKALVAEYNKTPKSAVSSRYLSPLEFNRRVKDGTAAMLHGGALTGPDAPDFFLSDAVAAFTERLGQSERAHFNKYLSESLVPHGLNLNEKLVKTWKDGAGQGQYFELGGGLRGRLDWANGRANLWIGNRRYRKINPETGTNLLYNPLSYTDDNRILAQWYPEEVADLVEKAVTPFAEENVPGVLRALDTFTKIWKGQTLLHPSWIIANMAGNVAFALNLGANLGKVAKFARPALRMVRAAGNQKQLAKATAEVAGRTLSGLDVLSGVAGDVLKQGQTDEAIIHLLQNGVNTPGMSRLLSPQSLRNPLKAAKGKLAELSAEAQRKMRAATEASLIDKLPHGGKLKGAGIQVSDAAAQVWGTWAKFNARAEEWIRTATYLALLDDGMEPVMAARKIADGMLDFSNLTKTDEKVRRLIPFWSWLKHSTIHGLRQVTENPKWFTIAPHAIAAMEEGINGENNLPRHLRPRWMNEQLAIMIGQDPERFAVSLGSLHPAEAATKFLAGFASPAIGAEAAQDLVAYFGNSFNPLLKSVLELTASREFFTGRTISARPDEGDLSLKEYLVRQLRPARELGLGDIRRAPLVTAAQRSIPEGVGRAIIGGRVQPASDERLAFQKKREFEDAIRAVRKRTNLAEREGEGSTSSRVRELTIYKAMIDSGLEREVPLWAREQLAQLAGN